MFEFLKKEETEKTELAFAWRMCRTMPLLPEKWVPDLRSGRQEKKWFLRWRARLS